MQRQFHARQSRAFRKLRELADLQLEQVAAATHIEHHRLRDFELHRIRLNAAEHAKAWKFIFERLASKLAQYAPDFGAEVPDEAEMQRTLETLGNLDLGDAALPPMEMPWRFEKLNALDPFRKKKGTRGDSSSASFD